MDSIRLIARENIYRIPRNFIEECVLEFPLNSSPKLLISFNQSRLSCEISYTPNAKRAHSQQSFVDFPKLFSHLVYILKVKRCRNFVRCSIFLKYFLCLSLVMGVCRMDLRAEISKFWDRINRTFYKSNRTENEVKLQSGEVSLSTNV